MYFKRPVKNGFNVLYLVHIRALMSLFYVNIRLYTNIILISLNSHSYTPTCFSPQGTSSGNTVTFREQGQQSVSSDVNIRLTF
jgi:hypothetical protein